MAYKAVVDVNGNLPALDSLQVVSNYDRMFDNLHSIYCDGNDHPKARTLAARVKDKFGRNIPVWVEKIFTGACGFRRQDQDQKCPSCRYEPKCL